MTLHNKIVLDIAVVLFLVGLMCGISGVVGQKQADDLARQESKIKKVIYEGGI